MPFQAKNEIAELSRHNPNRESPPLPWMLVVGRWTLGVELPSPLNPKLPVQRAVLDGLGHMLGADLFHPGQVGDRP